MAVDTTMVDTIEVDTTTIMVTDIETVITTTMAIDTITVEDIKRQSVHTDTIKHDHNMRTDINIINMKEIEKEIVKHINEIETMKEEVIIDKFL